MMELTMAAAHPNYKPAISFQDPDEVPDLHRSLWRSAAA
jgi:hypothetical protein